MNWILNAWKKQHTQNTRTLVAIKQFKEKKKEKKLRTI